MPRASEASSGPNFQLAVKWCFFHFHCSLFLSSLCSKASCFLSSDLSHKKSWLEKKMYNSQRSGTPKAAELWHSQLAAESLFFKPTKVGSREKYIGFTQWTQHKWKAPNCFTFQNEGESTITSSSDSLQDLIAWRTGLSCTAFWPLWGMPNIYELQSVFRSILTHCALPTEWERKGREKNEAVIATKPSLSTTVHHPSPSLLRAAYRIQFTQSLWRWVHKNN